MCDRNDESSAFLAIFVKTIIFGKLEPGAILDLTASVSTFSDNIGVMRRGGTSSSSRADDSCSSNARRLEVVSKQATKVTALSTRLEWKIDQFEKLMKLFKNGQNLISKQFGCPQAPSVTWELHVYPNGKREEDLGNVSFFLRQVGLQRGEDPIMTEFQIYALDANSQRVSVCRDTKDFTNQQGRGKFQVTREKMLAALKSDGSLLLICEVEYFPPGSKISVEQAIEADGDEADERNEFSLRESLREMLDNELFSDCIIKVGNKMLKAHRCILGQHSEVFRSMFAQESMIEAQNGIIDITDSRYEPVRAMLEFMYTGATDLVDTCADDILAIADKYAILQLKEQCERRLARSITIKNVASTAMFADTYSATILRHACTRFILHHHKDVLRTAEWKQLKRDRSQLANELLEAVLVGDVAPIGEYAFVGGAGGSDEAGTSSSTTNAVKAEPSGGRQQPPPRKRVRRVLARGGGPPSC